MTFNEGMQIDTSNISTGGGAGPVAASRSAAALGGLLIVVIALFLGVDPSSVVPQQQQIDTGGVEAPGYDLSHCKTGADANKYVECRVVATTNSVDGVWQQLLPGYTPPHTTLFHGQVQTGCGPATSDVGPFYCPVDQTAYFDTDFFQVLVDQFGSSGGPLAQEYVVAHEYGHHVQDLQGITRPRAAGSAGRDGRWRAHRTAGRLLCRASGRITRPSPSRRAPACRYLEPLSDKDIADALSAASSVGDDRIQKAGDRPGQPGVMDPRIVCGAAEVVHRRLPDRRPQQVRHLRDQQPWLGPPRP